VFRVYVLFFFLCGIFLHLLRSDFFWCTALQVLLVMLVLLYYKCSVYRTTQFTIIIIIIIN